MFTEASKVAIDTNQSAVLVCQSHSVPDPTFTWYNGSTRVTTNNRVIIDNSVIEGHPYPYQSKLTIIDVTMDDLGHYTCEGTNRMGSTRITIQLTVKSKIYITGIYKCTQILYVSSPYIGLLILTVVP